MGDLEKYLNSRNWSLYATTKATPGAKLFYIEAEWVGDVPIPIEEARAEYAALVKERDYLLARVETAEQERDALQEEKNGAWYDALAMGQKIADAEQRAELAETLNKANVIAMKDAATALDEAKKVIAPFAERTKDFVFMLGGMATVDYSALRRATEWMQKWGKK